MSYRMYIASHSKQSDAERDAIFQKVILPHMLQQKETAEQFLSHEFLQQFGCTVELELGKEPIGQLLLTQCPSYLPDSTLLAYSDYLPRTTNHPNYIGHLTKDMMLSYIKNLHQVQIKEIEQEYNTCQSDPFYATAYALAYLAECRMQYENNLKQLEAGQMPNCITNQNDYIIHQISQLMQRTDFDTTDLILYGW